MRGQSLGQASVASLYLAEALAAYQEGNHQVASLASCLEVVGKACRAVEKTCKDRVKTFQCESYDREQTQEEGIQEAFQMVGRGVVPALPLAERSQVVVCQEAYLVGAYLVEAQRKFEQVRCTWRHRHPLGRGSARFG